MASTDAKPVPQKNVAYRVTFPILDADGDLVTGASGLDSEISKDGGTFADCTNEATEIATSSGVYYLDLTSTEMNADTVAIIVKTSTSGAKTTTIIMYPEEAGDVRVNVTQFNGTGVTGRDIGASVLLSSGTGTGQVTLTSGRVNADITHIATAAVSTSTAQLGVNLVKIAGSAVNTSSAQLGVNVVNAAGTAWGSGAITAASIASNAITSAKIATDAIGAAQIADNAIDAGAIASNAITAAKIATDAIGAAQIAADAVTEIQSGLSTLNAAGVRTAVGLASANLDTQLGALTNLDATVSSRLASASYTAPDNTSIAAILVDTGTTLDGKIDTIDGIVDAIKLKTDLIPGDMDGLSLTEMLMLMGASLLGKLSGAATATVTIRAADDSKDRITATVDADGNRTAVTLDPS